MKKKTILTQSVLLLYFISSGQINKGSVLLGGDLWANSIWQENNGVKFKSSGFGFSPLAGKAIKDNLVLGGFLGIGVSDNDGVNGNNENHEKSYTAGMFMRKYGVIKNNFYGFIQGNTGFSYSKYEYIQFNGISVENKRTAVQASLSPGLSYKVSRKLHLEAGLREIASLGYSRDKKDYYGQGVINSSKTSSVFMSTSLNNFSSNLYFGFRLLLDKK